MNFRFQSLLQLKKNLGQQDSIAEATEVAIRSFVNSAPANQKFNEFLANQSQNVGIRVDSVDKKLFRQKIALGYLISVQQSLEIFLDNFRRDYRDLYDKEINVDEANKSQLNKIIDELEKKEPPIRALIGEHHLAIMDYYRLTRNEFVHADIIAVEKKEGKAKKIDLAYSLLLEHDPKIKASYPNLNAPNNIDNIGFDDFLLFTRAAKAVCEAMSLACKPKNADLLSYYKRIDLFNKLPRGSIRWNNAISADLRKRFGFSKTDADYLVNSALASLA
jgi:hypothetical protein